MDTTSSLEQATKILRDANIRYNTISSRVDEVENLIATTEGTDLIISRLNELESSLENASLNLADADSLLSLITSANNRINQIVDGTIPTEVQYNTDVLAAGNGILLDKSIPNKIKVNNNLKGYSLNRPYRFN